MCLENYSPDGLRVGARRQHVVEYEYQASGGPPKQSGWQLRSRSLGAMTDWIREEKMRTFLLAVFAMATSLSYAIEVVLSTEVQTPLRPTIKGVTNLPDGTKLAVVVSRKDSGYRAQAWTEVKSGRFAVGPVSQRGNDLNPGLYNLEVGLAAAADQPSSVREVIGRRGEKLQGPIAKRDGNSRTVRHTTTFQVGLVANAELDRMAREQARISDTKWWRRQCRDLCDNAEPFEREQSRPFSKPDCLKTCVSNPPAAMR